MKELYKAIHALGIEKSFTIDWVSTDRIAVYIDGEYFGIWDTVRKTFVD